MTTQSHGLTMCPLFNQPIQVDEQGRCPLCTLKFTNKLKQSRCVSCHGYKYIRANWNRCEDCRRAYHRIKHRERRGAA